MIRVLKKGGKIRIITDNAGFWLFHVQIPFLSGTAGKLTKVHYGGYIGSGKVDKHFALYTIDSLKTHFEAVGLRNIKVNYLWFQGERKIGKIMKIVTDLFIKRLLPRMAYPFIYAEALK